MLQVNQLSGFNARRANNAPLAGATPTGAWSFSRNIVPGFVSSKYAVTGTPARVTNLYDQSGNSRNLNDFGTFNKRPLETTGGPNTKQCAKFDTNTNVLTGATMTNFITSSSAFLIFSCVINGGVTLNSANMYANHSLFGDGNTSYHGIFAKNVSGTTPTFFGYNYDGSDDNVSIAALSYGTAYVLTLRHQGGTLYASVNGGTEVSVASGNTTSVGDFLEIGGGAASLGCDMSWFEGATFSTVPTLAERTAMIADFKSWVGA